MKRIQWLRTRRPGVRIPHGVPKKPLISQEVSGFFVFYFVLSKSKAKKISPGTRETGITRKKIHTFSIHCPHSML